MISKYKPKSHWGNHLWGFIHTISIIDYENNVLFNQNAIDNLHAIYNVFPCPKCKSMYAAFLQRLQFIDLREPMTLFFWSVDLHNAVNAKLGKPLWSYEKAIERWCTQI